MTRFAPEASSAPRDCRPVRHVTLHEGDARQVRGINDCLQTAAVAALI